ncbi:hypothetical protein DY000_02012086 [Brassica cretica]|uniref:Uncharacterized protein n=1 Tax=Brassica cretica TaxID=69181 RepID=A0ABQ7DBX8_BRACR|nr:hypothetical protein DY000_02012086 [Brassica cretica]
MGSRDDSEEHFTLNTDYSPLATCDLGTQQLMARLAAEEEIGDLRADGANDGKKQARKRKLISVVDSEEESDVEITPPTRSSKPRRQTTYGTATQKPILYTLTIILWTIPSLFVDIEAAILIPVSDDHFGCIEAFI